MSAGDKSLPPHWSESQADGHPAPRGGLANRLQRSQIGTRWRESAPRKPQLSGKANCDGAFAGELFVVEAFSHSFLMVENSTSIFFGTPSSIIIRVRTGPDEYGCGLSAAP